MSEEKKRSYGWIVLTGLLGLLALSSLGLLLAGVDTSEFQASTGTAWAEFAARESGAAAYIVRLLTLIGIAASGFNLLGAIVSATAFRTEQRWAWLALWLYPLTFTGYAFVFLQGDAGPLGIYYLVLAGIIALVLLLSARRIMARS